MAKSTHPELAVWPMSLLWGVAQLSVAFMLEVGRLSRGQGDVIDPLILTAILEANQAAIRHDPQLALHYADAASALPDELRRPISISALAASLRLPFESVRRRIAAWVAAGICVRTEAGIYVPQAVVTSEAYLAVQAARVGRLPQLHADLSAAGLELPPAPEPDRLAGKIRAADRALAEYILRSCDPVVELAGSPANAFVLLGLWTANGRGRPTSWSGRAATMGKPCAIRLICEQVGMPAETVRRRVLALQALGLAERRAGGWITTTPEALRPVMAQMLSANVANLRRLFGRLHELLCEDAPQAPG
ncbi:MAG: hypothetical protein JWQ97_805 [Phenylobacterium sp.]|nr:hypothetical protein [Phenylobacterium sp.]